MLTMTPTDCQPISHKWSRFATTDYRPVRVFHRGLSKGVEDPYTPAVWFPYGADAAITAVGRFLLAPAFTAKLALKASDKAEVSRFVGVPRAALIGATWGVAKGLGGGICSASVAVLFFVEGTFCTVAYPIVHAGQIVEAIDRKLETEPRDTPNSHSPRAAQALYPTRPGAPPTT